MGHDFGKRLTRTGGGGGRGIGRRGSGQHEQRELRESYEGGDGANPDEESREESCSPSPPGKGVPLTMRDAEELARTTEALVKENKHLRAENKNMYHLFEENKDLREEVQVRTSGLFRLWWTKGTKYCC